MARTGCGGFVDSVGGAITMMNMLKLNENSINGSDSDGIFYDCVWVIRPAQGYNFLKTHISLKVETFEYMASFSEITIVEGTNSVGRILEKITSSTSNNVQSKNLITSITSGFYVRLRGKFNYESRLAIVYTAFSYSSKYAISFIFLLIS
jgi:hypothetical protein